MTDLSKGIIEIDGVIVATDSKLSDFDGLSSADAKILVSKRGNTYISFLNPICSNGVNAYVDVSFYVDSPRPEIKLFPYVPEELKGDAVAQSKYKVAAAKQWLKGMIAETPTTDCDEGISYHFGNIHISAFTHNDIHYGLVGGEINVAFHEV